MALISHSKDKPAHYIYTLNAALLSGQFSSPTPAPAVTPAGAPLAWPELLRKFTKHTSQTDVATIASHTRDLGVCLSEGGDFDVDSKDGQELVLGEECTAGDDANAREEAQAGYDKLKAQETPKANDVRGLLPTFYQFPF